MSSMRNAVQRRVHRERAQPANREKWGILEKHKDYSLRARDYSVKKAKLQRLREKADTRNPDEFAFGMMSGKSRTQGKHGARDTESAALSLETVKLLKTQDAGYLRVVGERIRRQMMAVDEEVRVQEGISGVSANGAAAGGGGGGGRKVVFVDSVEEQRERALEDEGKSDDDEEQGDFDEVDEEEQRQQKTQPKSKKQLEAEKLAQKEMLKARKLKIKAAEARSKKLQALTDQHKNIVAAEQELDWQRGKMENSVGGVNKHGLRWKVRERKR
ncbi:hypothetical protein AJ80_00039 [Polytolypa hystricis UAMH7299]|uniref:U3 small nucleolar RNA-associated protein 11 n=1 Tax=Polytolypa hystricis (strain UAMH7299) TaxID=1447883 RepID=A0A2B7Z4H3_POLH7|nr:hypothetical protein AJ80_00039 [Polytolypa hystricis UAMH7299]